MKGGLVAALAAVGAARDTEVSALEAFLPVDRALLEMEAAVTGSAPPERAARDQRVALCDVVQAARVLALLALRVCDVSR